MFHVVYSRHYWDTEDQGTFESVQTLYRNVPYSQIGFLSGKCSELKEQADKTYAEYESKQEHKSDPTQFYKSEAYVVDDKDYYKTYKDMYPDSYQIPPGLVPQEEDYFHSYGQKCQFMLKEDFDEAYTWFGKDFTQEQINQAYEDRDNKNIKEIVDSYTA